MISDGQTVMEKEAWFTPKVAGGDLTWAHLPCKSLTEAQQPQEVPSPACQAPSTPWAVPSPSSQPRLAQTFHPSQSLWSLGPSLPCLGLTHPLRQICAKVPELPLGSGSPLLVLGWAAAPSTGIPTAPAHSAKGSAAFVPVNI